MSATDADGRVESVGTEIAVAEGSAVAAGPPIAYTVPGCADRYADVSVGKLDPFVSSTTPPAFTAATPAVSASGKFVPVASKTVPGSFNASARYSCPRARRPYAGLQSWRARRFAPVAAILR